MLGYSIYFSQVDEAYIKRMDEKGIKTIFTSLHIPEERLDPEDIRAFLLDSSKHDRDVIIDISPNTLSVIGVENYLSLKNLGVKTVRIDFGISDEEIVELQHDFRIVLNASTLDQEKITTLQTKGLVLQNVVAMHNFYPREYTGLSMDFFQKKNEIFQKNGIKVWAFIPGNKVQRGPIFAGLPTVEKHRNVVPYVSYLELTKRCSVDGVFIGDPQLDQQSLDMIHSYTEKDIITLPTENLSPFFPKELIYTNRLDESEAVIRIEQGRELFANSKEIFAATKPGMREKGSITIDNEKYLRYKGESQIMKIDLPEDPRVQLVGNVEKDYVEVLTFIEAGTRFIFR